MINLQHITVTFADSLHPVSAVTDVSLKIETGEIFGIVGTSGAGKSTLLRTINLLQRPTGGHVLIEGTDITDYDGENLRKLRLQMGMIFQHFNLIHTKTVFDNVAFTLKAAGVGKTEIQERVPPLLELVGLADKTGAYPGQLSGGQKQRVGIARALANNPKILLCDEPTSALDSDTTNSILELLKDINRKTGITMVLITHEMAVVKKICDRVAVMSQAVAVEVDTVFNIFANPKADFTKQLIQHSNNFSLPERLLADIKGKILRILYRGGGAEEPVISDTAQKYSVAVNILHGQIEYISDLPLGVLLVNINGAPAIVEEAISYIKSRVESVEVLYG
ncbi:MAG TPA: ATP-binding cassette domain-containing protein [Negativicutes bacterium]|nr:ATP-binding cassette domain-containing protein [Negativicutes bacterium]